MRNANSELCWFTLNQRNATTLLLGPDGSGRLRFLSYGVGLWQAFCPVSHDCVAAVFEYGCVRDVADD